MKLTKRGKNELFKVASHMTKQDWQNFNRAEEKGSTHMGCHLEA